VVRVETDLTSVLLLAVDKNNNFVTTLKREDIRVFENNAPQELAIFQRETDLPLSLVILVDASESQKGVLKDEKIAADVFVDAVIHPDKDRAAVISFTGRPTLEQGLTGDALKLKRAINRLQIILPPEPDENAPNNSAVSSKPDADDDAVGWTGVWDAVWASANDVLSTTPEQTRRAIILLSDGDDTTSFTKRQEAIDFAVQHNVVVYSIGIRDESFPDGKLDVSALRKVSEKTGGRAFFPHNGGELLAAFAQIQQELRSQYLVAYSPVNKTRDASYRQVRIEIVNPELRKQKLRLLYRQGYYARQTSTKK
jgi:VWFA-related protein